MEINTPQFRVAALKSIVVNTLLSGDNAVVSRVIGQAADLFSDVLACELHDRGGAPLATVAASR